MVKQLCPHCYKSVSIPEDASGTSVPCPECGQAFEVPKKYSPAVGSAPTLPPPPPPSEPVAVSTPPAVVPAGYTHSRGFTLSPAVIGWIPTAALTAILLLTFMPWVELAPGGHAVYSQGVWRNITGRAKRDFQLEDLMLKELPPPSIYDRISADWYLMIPYLVMLIFAVVLAWADRLDSKAAARRIPWLWPHRNTLLVGLAGTAALILALEASRGFGLERALNSAISEKFRERREKAGDVVGEQKKIDFEESQETAKYGLERCGLWLALGLHMVVLSALLAKLALDLRGDKPPPRIAIQY